jgi:uncharacterized protein DUF2255
MAVWTSDELEGIGAAEELQIASERRDGTLRRPVTIWVVRHGDDLYVRSVNGRGSSWFRGVEVRHEGRIRPAASTKTSSSSRPRTSTTRSTPSAARSTAATPPASSTPSRAWKRKPRRSSSCRASEETRPRIKNTVARVLRFGLGRVDLPRRVLAATRRYDQADTVNSPAMDARHERVARNEAMYRSVNREIEQASEHAGDGPQDRVDAICECGKDGCSATIDLTIAELDEAHQQRDRFVVSPGHEDEQIERVVTRTERYLVVDKFGDAEAVAEDEERRQGE